MLTSWLQVSNPLQNLSELHLLMMPLIIFFGRVAIAGAKSVIFGRHKDKVFFSHRKGRKKSRPLPLSFKKIFRTLLISGAPNGLISSLASIRVWEFYSTTMATNMYSDLTHAASWAWISAYLPPPIYPFPTTLAHHRPGKSPPRIHCLSFPGTWSLHGVQISIHILRRITFSNRKSPAVVWGFFCGSEMPNQDKD